MAIFNCLYFTTTVFAYIGYFIDPSHICLGCSKPPHTSSYYKDQVTALIVKGVVFLIAIIIELLVAIQISMKTILPTANGFSKCSRIFQIILLWNTFVFAQIWVGLLLVPACIFLIIAPLQTIPVLCAEIAFPPLLMVFIAILLRLGNQFHIRNWNYRINAMVCIHSSRHMILLL